MKLKRIITAVATGTLLFQFTSIALAQPYPPQNTADVGNQSTSTNPNPAKSNPAAMTNLMNRAMTEINRRITSLNEVLARLSSSKRLTDAQKSTLSSQIQTEITNLTNLKTKIQGDKDIVTLRADTKSIVTSYRVYLLFLPQMRLLAAADALGNAADKMSSLSGKLQTRINTAQAAGKDVSALQPLLTSMNASITSVNTQISAVITAVTPLTPDGYPGNKSILLTAKQNLMAAYQSLRDAGGTAKQIIQGLAALPAGNNTSSSSSMMHQ